MVDQRSIDIISQCRGVKDWLAMNGLKKYRDRSKKYWYLRGGDSTRHDAVLAY